VAVAVVIPPTSRRRTGGVVRWSTSGRRTIWAIPPTTHTRTMQFIVAVERAIRRKLRGRPRTVEAEAWALLTTFEGSYMNGSVRAPGTIEKET
jgi:hypothetical protein